MRKLALLSCALLLPLKLLAADSLNLPEDPRQSISYWKAHTISAEADADVRDRDGVCYIDIVSHSNVEVGQPVT